MRWMAGLAGCWMALVGFACAEASDPFLYSPKDGGSGGSTTDQDAQGDEVADGEPDDDAAEETGTGSGGNEGDVGGAGGYGAEPVETGGSGGGSSGSGGAGGADPWCVPAVSGPCEPISQCGCGPTQACDVVNGTGVTDCYKPGNIPLSEPCTKAGDCARGATCLQGCKLFCAKNSDCPGEGAVCFQVENSSSKPVPGMKVCTDHCKPWLGNSCGSGLACGSWSQIGEYPGTFVCIPGGSSMSTCTGLGQCAPGYACAAGSPSGRCRRWCRVGFTDCSAGQTCQPFYDGTVKGMYWGTTEVGLCL